MDGTPAAPEPTVPEPTVPEPTVPEPTVPEPTVPEPTVEVRRSARRRRTVSAYRQDGRTVVLIPARMSRAEEARWVATMLDRLERQERRTRPSDPELLERARALSERFLGARARPTSVRWATDQRRRWGSCSVDEGAIRLSSRLQGMPTWVVDYVLLHELAHLLEASHGPAFWALLSGYPDLERAKAFLDGVGWAETHGQEGEAGPDPAARPTQLDFDDL